MINIAVVISELGYGGAQTMLVRLIRSMDRRKFNIHVFVRECKNNNSIEDELVNMGISCSYLELYDNTKHCLKIIHKIKAFCVVKKALDAFKPDIVHSHLEYFYSPLYCIIRKKIFVLTVHSQPYRIASKKLKFLLKTLEVRNSLKVVGCAQCISKDLVKILGLKKAIVSTIYNPIQLQDYCTSNHNKNAEFSYIHVGRMEPVKNQCMLLEAFSMLIKDRPFSNLVLVGDGVLKEKLEIQCESLGIMPKVRFLGNQREIPQLLCLADVFVLSSDSEACPMTVLEAMASGIPVISTNVGGVSELIEDSGILVQKGDKKGLYSAMVKIQESPETLKAMRSKELEIVKKYDVSSIATQYEQLYVSFCGKEIKS